MLALVTRVATAAPGSELRASGRISPTSVLGRLLEADCRWLAVLLVLGRCTEAAFLLLLLPAAAALMVEARLLSTPACSRGKQVKPAASIVSKGG